MPTSPLSLRECEDEELAAQTRDIVLLSQVSSEVSLENVGMQIVLLTLLMMRKRMILMNVLLMALKALMLAGDCLCNFFVRSLSKDWTMLGQSNCQESLSLFHVFLITSDNG